MNCSKLLIAAGISIACLSSFALGVFLNADFKVDVSINQEGEIGIGNSLKINGKSGQQANLSVKKNAADCSPEQNNITDTSNLIPLGNVPEPEVQVYFIPDESDSENLINDPFQWSTRLFDGTLADFDIQPCGNHTVNVYQVSDETYGAKVIYRNLDLIPGQTYTLEFDAYCQEGTGKIGAGIMEEETWASDAYEVLDITQKKTHFKIESRPISNYAHPMRLFIDYGFETGSYVVKNVSITMN